MRLDIALMGLLGFVGFLNNHVSFSKASIHIAVTHLGSGGNIGRLGRRGFNTSSNDPIMNHRCRFQHSLIHVCDMGQLLILHVDQLQCLSSRLLIHSSHRRNGVTVIQSAASRHAVFQDIRQALIASGQIRHILKGNHRFNARQLLCLGCVDFQYLGMCMRRAQDAAYQLPRCTGIRSVARLACDLVDTVGAIKSLPYHFVFFVYVLLIVTHCSFPLYPMMLPSGASCCACPCHAFPWRQPERHGRSCRSQYSDRDYLPGHSGSRFHPGWGCGPAAT